MFCINCGIENNGNSRFCGNCGSSIIANENRSPVNESFLSGNDNSKSKAFEPIDSKKDVSSVGSTIALDSADKKSNTFDFSVKFLIDVVSEHIVVLIITSVLIVLFLYGNRQLHFFGNFLYLIFSLLFSIIGILGGDIFRRFVIPDTFYANGVMDILWKKLFFMYGPQIIGSLFGMGFALMATLAIVGPYSAAPQLNLEQGAMQAKIIQDKLNDQTSVDIEKLKQPIVAIEKTVTNLKTELWLKKDPEFLAEGSGIKLTTTAGDFSIYTMDVSMDIYDLFSRGKKGDCLLLEGALEQPIDFTKASDTIKKVSFCK